MDNPVSKLTDALAGKVEESKPKTPQPPPASKAASAPKFVTAYKEYQDKDSDYMKSELNTRVKRLAPKGMPKRSK